MEFKHVRDTKRFSVYEQVVDKEGQEADILPIHIKKDLAKERDTLTITVK